MAKNLTAKQLIFANAYLETLNGTEAARRAYKSKSDNVLGVIAYENLRKPKVREYIDERLKVKQMSADEALTILAEHAKGDLAEFMDISSVGFSLKLLDDDGNKKNTRLIHKIKQKTTIFISKKESEEDREVHETEIELYDAQAAIDKILRVAGRYKDNVDLTSGGKPIKVVGVGIDVDKL